MSTITCGDIVNARLAATPEDPLLRHRGRVLRLSDSDLTVEMPAGDERTV